MEDKTYKVPDEIVELFDSAESLYEARDFFVKIKVFFKYKKLVELTSRAVRARNKAWRMVLELYPELRGLPLVYRRHLNVVVEQKTEE